MSANNNETTFYNLNIERAVISSIVYAPEIFETWCASIDADYFYHTTHRGIYQTILILQKHALPIDEAFIQQKYAGDWNSDVFFDILSTTPLSNLAPYIDELARLSENRRMIKVARESISIIEKLMDAEAAKAYMSAEIDKAIRVSEDDFDTFSELKQIIKKSPPLQKIPTGLSFFDQHLDGGLEPKFVMVGGKPNMGKTSAVVQIMKHITKKEKTVFWSLEFSPHDVINKQGGVNGAYENQNWLINTKTRSLEKICMKIGQLSRQGVRVFVIDSQMKLKAPPARNREEEETLKFAMLEEASSRFGVLIILIYQVTEGGKAFYSSQAEYFATYMIEVEKGSVELEEYAKEAMPLSVSGQPVYGYRYLRYVKCKGAMEIRWLYRFHYATQTFQARLNETKVLAAVKQWQKEKKEAEKNGKTYVADRLREYELSNELYDVKEPAVSEDKEEQPNIDFAHIKL